MIPLLLACTGTTTPTPSHSASTQHSGTRTTGHGALHSGATTHSAAHSGATPNAIDVDTSSFAACADPYDVYDSPTLVGTSLGGGDVSVRYEGVLTGCSCDGTTRARYAGTDTIDLRFDAGDCDGLLCCVVDATLHAIPSGDWTLTRVGYPSVSVAVTVP